MIMFTMLAIAIYKRTPQQHTAKSEASLNATETPQVESSAVRIHAHVPETPETPTKETTISPVSEGLLANLEAAADKHLPSPAPAEGMQELTVSVPAPERLAPLFVELAKELGGSAVSSANDSGSMRIMFLFPPRFPPEVHIPSSARPDPDRRNRTEILKDFSRRAELLTGAPLPEPIKEEGVFAITLRAANKD